MDEFCQACSRPGWPDLCPSCDLRAEHDAALADDRT